VPDQTKTRNRIVIETPGSGRRGGAQPGGPKLQQGRRQGIVALTVIGAAALATFLALFLTSRPYDPMDSTVSPVQTVPDRSLASLPAPKSSPSVSSTPQSSQAETARPSPEPVGETVPDDAEIQSQIEQALNADATLSKLDLSTLVEGGKVTIVGSVKSLDLKQRVENVLRSVKGVTTVDNQLVVTDATP